jgi:hypothetical protein
MYGVVATPSLACQAANLEHMLFELVFASSERLLGLTCPFFPFNCGEENERWGGKESLKLERVKGWVVSRDRATARLLGLLVLVPPSSGSTEHRER